MVILFTALLSIHRCHEPSFLGTRWAGTVTSQLLKKVQILRLTCLTYPTSPLLILQNISLSLFWPASERLPLFSFSFHKTHKHTFLSHFLPYYPTGTHSSPPSLSSFSDKIIENSFGITMHLHIFYLR